MPGITPGRRGPRQVARHCPEQHGYIAVWYDALRCQHVSSSRHPLSHQCLKASGIKLYDDCLKLKSRDGEVRLRQSSLGKSDAPRSPDLDNEIGNQ